MELPQMEQDKIKDIIDRFDVTDIQAENRYHRHRAAQAFDRESP